MSLLMSMVRGGAPHARAATLAAGCVAGLASLVLLQSGAGPVPHVVGAPGESSAFPATSPADRALSAYGRLPLSFVPNRGQAAEGVRFSARGPGFGFAFMKDRIALSSQKGTVALRFVGASPAATLTGSDRLPGTVNYLVGPRSAWRTGIPTYGAVVYGGVWPGIDMAVAGRGGALKYEFRVAPGADPARIALAYAGAQRVSVAAGGALAVQTPGGVLTDSRPVTYQLVGGVRRPVESRYVVTNAAAGTYTFALGPYDPCRPLVIDPGLEYSTYLGGSREDFPNAGIAIDKRGNAYVAGRTVSPDFPTTAGAFAPTDPDPANQDGFVTKLNRDGSALIYSTYLGGTGSDILGHIDVDRWGYAYVVGQILSPNFPTTPDAFDPTYNGAQDGSVTKLSRDGSSLVYSTYVGGTNADTALGIDVDKRGYAYMTGATMSPDHPTTPGAYDRTHNGDRDATVVKLTPDGSALIYSTFIGGSDDDFDQHGIAVDKKGNAFIGGQTKSSNFPTTPGGFQDADPDLPGDDAFVLKLDSRGSRLLYSTYLGGPSSRQPDPSIQANERVFALEIDRQGHAYVTGQTDSPAFPTTPGAFDPTYNGAFDTFVTKLNRSGSGLVYSTYLGGDLNETAFDIDVWRERAYVSGRTTSVGFPTTPNAFQPADSDGAGVSDGILSVLNESGTDLVYSTYLGGTGFDQGFGVAVRGRDVFTTGTTEAANFPTTPGSFQAVDLNPAPGLEGREVYVMKLRIHPKGEGKGHRD